LEEIKAQHKKENTKKILIKTEKGKFKK